MLRIRHGEGISAPQGIESALGKCNTERPGPCLRTVAPARSHRLALLSHAVVK